MEKSWYESKTIWGFGIASLIALGQVSGVDVASSTVANVVQVLAGALGLYGLRDAVG